MAKSGKPCRAVPAEVFRVSERRDDDADPATARLADCGRYYLESAHIRSPLLLFAVCCTSYWNSTRRNEGKACDQH